MSTVGTIGIQSVHLSLEHLLAESAEEDLHALLQVNRARAVLCHIGAVHIAFHADKGAAGMGMRCGIAL